MTESGEHKFDQLLRRLGFESKHERTGIVWSNGKSKSPYHISLVEKSGLLSLQTLELTWNINTIVKSLQTELMGLWGRNLRISTDIIAPQCIAVMVEISEKPLPSKKPTSRQNPPTAIGWTFRVDSQDQAFKLFFENFLVLGLNAPTDWPADLIQATTKAVLGKAYRYATCRSIHEFECPMLYATMNLLDGKSNVDDIIQLDELLKLREPSFARGSWRHTQSAWTYVFKDHTTQGEHSESNVPFEQTYQGMEILEARAAGESIRGIDHEIVNRRGDIPQIKGKNTIALKRRLMRFLQTNVRDLNPDDIEQSIDEPAFASAKGLAASALLRMHYQDHHFEKALNALKIWTEVARATQGQLENIDALNAVLPEFAGLFLAPIAPEQALHALERAQSSGDEPRILARMTEIAKTSEAVDQELEYLERWRTIERRQDQLEHIISRQVELQIHTEDVTAAAMNLEYLVVKHAEHISRWLPYVDDLANHGDPQRALAILERMERHLNQKNGVRTKDKIGINASIARIWDIHLDRVDLALPRYITILELSDDLDEALIAAAEDAMERAGDQGGSLLSKKKRWVAMPQSAQSKSDDFGRKLIKQARELNDIETEFIISLDLLEMHHDIPDLTSRLEIWLQYDLPWRTLLSAVINLYPKDQIPVALARALSSVARVKLEDHDLAILFLMQTDQIAILDETEFTYLLDQLTTQGRSADIEGLVLSRLKTAIPESRLTALKYLIKNTVLEGAGQINQALIDDWMDRRDANLIVERWTSLIEDKHIEQARGLLALIENDLLPTITIKFLIEDLTETTLAYPPEQTDHLLMVLIRLSVEINEHSTEAVQKAAHLTASSSDPQAAAPYLKLLLERSVAIDLPDTLVHRALQGQNELLVQFNLQRIGSGKDVDKTSYARNAVELIKRSGDVDSYTTPIIEQLIKDAAVRPDDLSIIRKFAVALHRPKLMVDGLMICIAQTDDTETKRKYADEAAELAQKSLKDPALAYHILKDVIDTSAASIDALHLANLALKAGQPERSRQIALELLRNPDSIQNPELVLESCEMLVALQEERSLVAGIIQTLISWADSASNIVLKASLMDFSIFKGLCTQQELATALMTALTAGDIHKSAGYMTKIFERAESESESLSDVVASTKSVLNELGFENYWWQLIGEMLHGQDARQTTPTLRRELLCQYGLFLYEQDGRQREAVETLLILCRENPKDKRIWMPVYILLEETQDSESQIAHLESIIPHIEDEPSILNDYPIHIETLKAALKRARDRVSSGGKKSQVLFSESSADHRPPKTGLNVLPSAIAGSKGLLTKSNDRSFAPVATRATIGGSSSEVGSAAANLSPELVEQKSHFQETDPGRISPIYFVAGAAAQFELPKDQPNDIDHSTATSPESQFEPAIEPQPAYQYQSEADVAATDEGPSDGDERPKPLDIDNPNLRFSTEADRVVASSLNWRTMAASLEAPRNAAEILARTAFASEAEKHIAIQVAALLCGDMGSLDNWHWRVWRESNEFDYPLTGKERLPKFTDLTQLGSPPHRFLNAFAPAIARNYRDRFTISERIRSKNPLSRMVMRQLKLTDPVLQRTGLKHHGARIEQARLTFVDTPDLGNEIFLDASRRSIHFSADVCTAKPPGYLMHRSMALIWAMQMQYHVILRTDARKEIDPLYQMFLSYNRATPLERIRLAFSTENGKIQKLTQGLNRDKLSSLAQQAGLFDSQSIQLLQSDMIRHVYRIMLAESLDLIGIFEALTGEIVTTLSREEIQQRLRKSVVLRDLFAFATKLFL